MTIQELIHSKLFSVTFKSKLKHSENFKGLLAGELINIIRFHPDTTKNDGIYYSELRYDEAVEYCINTINNTPGLSWIRHHLK